MHYPPKTEQQATENAAEQKRMASAEWWTIGLTAALVAATLLQFGALFWQGWQLKSSVTVADKTGREARDAIKAAQVSAEATSRIADASIAAELAQVIPTGTGVTVEGYPAGGEGSRHAFAIVEVTNFGRTPAFVSRTSVNICLGSALPHIAKYENQITFFSGEQVIVPRGAWKLPKAFSSFSLTETEYQNVLHGNEFIWVYGFVLYSDFLRGEHTVGFCGRWVPQGIGTPQPTFQPIDLAGNYIYHHYEPNPSRAIPVQAASAEPGATEPPRMDVQRRP
jgi:hypothetical protein